MSAALLWALCMPGFVLAQATGSAAIDRVLVVVNDDVITESEFTTELGLIVQELRARNVPIPPEEDLRRQALERMVIERIQLQRATQIGVVITDAALNEALGTLAAQNNLPPERLREAVEAEGIDFDEFKARITRELTIARLRDRRIGPRVFVSEDEIDTALQSNPGRPGSAAQATELNVSHILFAVPEGASETVVAERRQIADRVAAELRQGYSFEEAAARFSDSRDALEGGRLGWRTPAELPTLFTEAVAGLQAGQVSAVLRSRNGFHLVRLNDSRGGSRQQQVSQSLARHILLRPSEFQSADEVVERLELLRQRIDNGADFADLARRNSEDARTRTEGGNLGWVSSGDVETAMGRAIRSLGVGEVSAPFETRSGYHIVQLLDKRSAPVSGDANRELARQQIFTRKANELYDRWIRELRDQAFVQYRLNASG